MAKKYQERLGVVLKVAKSEYEKALNAYSQLSQQHQAEINKCQSLKQYRKEYVQNINQTGKAGMKANELQIYFRFIHELDNLCQKQYQLIDRLDGEKKSAHEFYLKAKKKADSLEKIIEKEVTKDRKLAAKREQKALDELAQQSQGKNYFNKTIE